MYSKNMTTSSTDKVNQTLVSDWVECFFCTDYSIEKLSSMLSKTLKKQSKMSTKTVQVIRNNKD
ncbi:hypothetical protein MASR1M45_05950 [Candidatus Kapaibacterium sp.]